MILPEATWSLFGRAVYPNGMAFNGFSCSHLLSIFLRHQLRSISQQIRTWSKNNFRKEAPCHDTN